MAFHEIRLPEGIERDAVGGPGFKTTVITLFSGREKRNVDWQLARGRWDIGYGVRDVADMRDLLNFFYARQGRAHGFRFKDWLDYFADDSAIGVGDGVETSFNLQKQYVSGPTTYTRRIYKPVTGTVVMYVDDVEESNVVVDYTTGVVTFAIAPVSSSVITADFEFDVPVRFDIDEIDISLLTQEVGSAPNIPIIELRL